MKTAEKCILFGLVAVIVLQLIYGSRLLKENNDLKNRMGTIENRIMSIEGNVSSRVSSILNKIEEENSLIKRVDWQFMKMEEGNSTLKCQVSLNRLGKEAKPYLLYRVREDVSWLKENLELDEGLNYKADIMLDSSKDYEYQVFVDGDTQESGDIGSIPRHIYKYTEFKSGLFGDYNHTNDNSRTRMTVYLDAMSKTEAEALQIKSAFVKLCSGDNTVDTIAMVTAEEFEKIYFEDNKNSGAGRDSSAKVQEAVKEKVMEMAWGQLRAQIDFSSYESVIDKISVLAEYGDGHQDERIIYP
jgi:hypothetical protein